MLHERATLLATLKERAREGSEYGDLINAYIKDVLSLSAWACLCCLGGLGGLC